MDKETRDYIQYVQLIVWIVGLVLTIWNTSIPDHLKSLAVSLFAVVLLWLYVNTKFVKKSDLKAKR